MEGARSREELRLSVVGMEDDRYRFIKQQNYDKLVAR